MDTSSTSELKQRFITLDVIRGIAILGILIMNIQSFSMISAAYLNPTAYGDFTGINKWVWVVSHTIADQKFMSIFSILFGASIVLITQKIDEEGGTAWHIHYKRNFWLLVFGAIHSYLLWYGDILFPYAVCSFFVFFMRKLSVRKLFITGILIFSIASVIYLLFGLSMQHWPKETITEVQVSWSPEQEMIEHEVNAYTGSFLEQMEERVKAANDMHTDVFFLYFFWRITGLMLIGMALYKSGFLIGKWTIQHYWKTVFIMMPIGLALSMTGIFKLFKSEWSFEYGMFLGGQFNYWGSLLLAIGYIAIINLIVLSGKFEKVTSLFSSVGRQALTNYLVQTIICTFIFYGFGLGLFGQVNRSNQLLIVLGVWILQVFYSVWWQKRFYYGPFEWLWRSATFWEWQKFKK